MVLKVWAWVWLGAMALLGWAPALLVSYGIAVALALAFRWRGPVVFDAAYFGMLAAGLVLLVQVRNHFAFEGARLRRFTLAGGGALALVWVGAYVGFRIWAGL